MNEVLGYDCDGNEIYEYRILRAIWSNDIDIKDLEDADPRQYCAVIGDDGTAYAISVYDWWYKDLIRKRENIPDDEEIPIIVKPIEEMENYEVAICSDDGFSCREFCYGMNESSRNELKEKLNSILKNNHNNDKKMVKTK